MTIPDFLSQALVGGLVGMLGQCGRVIMGITKARAEATAKGLSFKDDVFDLGKLGGSLLFGAMAGWLGLLVYNKFQALGDIDWQQFITVLGFGYAGSDFIEGFFQRTLPQMGNALPGAQGQAQPVDGAAPDQEVLAATVMKAVRTVVAQDPDLSNATDAGRKIIDLCEQEWPADSGNCSAFVKDVASALGVTLTGQADDIVDQITGAGWSRLAGGVAAKDAADQGQLVVAGLKGASMAEPGGNGHVAVVVSGPLAQGKYPTGYWGRLNGTGEKYKTLNWSWRGVDRDKVVYASRVVA